jgi:catechol 2,3-dioxygenase-like lactoylglutathione lyase family enzyme
MDSTLRFYTEVLGFAVDFNFEDFYVGIRRGEHVFHLKLVDEEDPSIPYVRDGGHMHFYFQIESVEDFARELKSKGVVLAGDVHETRWQTREVIVEDDQGHTIYFGEPI